MYQRSLVPPHAAAPPQSLATGQADTADLDTKRCCDELVTEGWLSTPFTVGLWLSSLAPNNRRVVLSRS